MVMQKIKSSPHNESFSHWGYPVRFKWYSKIPEGSSYSHAEYPSYSGFKMGNLDIKRGSCVMIRCNQYGTDGVEDFDIARILVCYDTETGRNNLRGKVQWYTRVRNIPVAYLNKLTLVDELVEDMEVLQDNRPFSNDIDLETIMATCYVEEGGIHVQPLKHCRPAAAQGCCYFVCRLAFGTVSGKRNQITAITKFTDPNSEPSIPCSPGKENIPPCEDGPSNSLGGPHKRPSSGTTGVSAGGSGTPAKRARRVLQPSDEASPCHRPTPSTGKPTPTTSFTRKNTPTTASTRKNTPTTASIGKNTPTTSAKTKPQQHQVTAQVDVRSPKKTPNRNLGGDFDKVEAENMKTPKEKVVSTKKGDKVEAQNLKTDKKKLDTIKNSGIFKKLDDDAIKSALERIDNTISSDDSGEESSETEEEQILREKSKVNVETLSISSQISVSSSVSDNDLFNNRAKRQKVLKNHKGKNFSSIPLNSNKVSSTVTSTSTKSTVDTPSKGTPRKGSVVSSSTQSTEEGNSSIGSVTPRRGRYAARAATAFDTPSSTTKRTFPCNQCDEVFPTQYRLKDHLEDEHDVYELSPDKSPTPKSKRRTARRKPHGGGQSTRRTGHCCRQCGETCPSRRALEEHEQEHDSIFTPLQDEKGRGRRTTAGRGKTPAALRLGDRSSTASASHTTLEAAKTRLHVAAVPDSLPCREIECQHLYDFVESKLMDGNGGCMYISGVPGTGKTATVREVSRLLQQNQADGGLPPFLFVEVNALKLSQPQQVWVEVWRALTGQQRVTAQHAAQLLEKRFRQPGPGALPSVLLVDELDLLWTRKQEVLYNLFEWPSLPGSRLVVVAVANTMDLPERVMKARVASRLGLTRVTFHPYTHHQLQEIISSRLAGLNSFDDDAVQLVARKVAAVSGDARRALDICRRAAEVAQAVDGAAAIVGVGHVDAALKEMFTSPNIMAIRNCSAVERQVLQAAVAEYTRTGLEETTLERLYGQFESLSAFEGRFKHVQLTGVVRAVTRLSGQRLLTTDPSSRHLAQRIRLNLSVQDVKFALGSIQDDS